MIEGSYDYHHYMQVCLLLCRVDITWHCDAMRLQLARSVLVPGLGDDREVMCIWTPPVVLAFCAYIRMPTMAFVHLRIAL